MKKRTTVGQLALALHTPPSNFGVTLGGVQFARDATLWSFRDGLTKVFINFSTVPSVATPLVSSLRVVLGWYLENRAANTVVNLFSRFLDFSRYLQATEVRTVNELTDEHFLNYRVALGRDHEHVLTALRTFLKKWFAMRLPGVSPELNACLQSIRIKGGDSRQGSTDDGCGGGTVHPSGRRVIPGHVESGVRCWNYRHRGIPSYMVVSRHWISPNPVRCTQG